MQTSPRPTHNFQGVVKTSPNLVLRPYLVTCSSLSNSLIKRKKVLKPRSKQRSKPRSSYKTPGTRMDLARRFPRPTHNFHCPKVEMTLA